MSNNGHTAGGLEQLGDFTTTTRVLPLCVAAIGIGIVSTGVAWVLLRLIGLFTNLFFFGRLDTSMTSPAGNHLGLWVVLIPVVGGLIIGLMARYGSERIRGHGIPEAIEAILMSGSKVEPKLAFLKPTSAAISIGSGGPFGAEGPIIMTCGAVGSLLAQFFRLTSAERKTLLVAGAAAGMAATFASPVAAALLGVELLLFEWKPRSLLPVALASATAGWLRRFILGYGPLFAVPPHKVAVDGNTMLCLVVCGLLAGVLSYCLTWGVYAFEDAFGRLPIHWMWWPAIGGVAIGIGGYIFPQALGVGYDTIGLLLLGPVPLGMLLGVLLVKSMIWVIALGSGTSGGVLAPLLMMGAALGGLEAHIFPDMGLGFWPLISMGAILGGTMRVPFTSLVFALELTQDVHVLLPLFIAVSIAYAFTVLALKRSILTEKIARRGYHMTREYAIDPMEIVFVREAMRECPGVVAFGSTPDQVTEQIGALGLKQRLYPVVDDRGTLKGVMRGQDNAVVPAVMAYAEEPLRAVLERMAEKGLTRLPVVDAPGTERLVGMITLTDLLRAAARNLESERRGETMLHVTLPRLLRRREVVH